MAWLFDGIMALPLPPLLLSSGKAQIKPLRLSDIMIGMYGKVSEKGRKHKEILNLLRDSNHNRTHSNSVNSPQTREKKITTLKLLFVLINKGLKGSKESNQDV
jgi:hypothetical protein